MLLGQDAELFGFTAQYVVPANRNSGRRRGRDRRCVGVFVSDRCDRDKTGGFVGAGARDGHDILAGADRRRQSGGRRVAADDRAGSS